MTGGVILAGAIGLLALIGHCALSIIEYRDGRKLERRDYWHRKMYESSWKG